MITTSSLLKVVRSFKFATMFNRRCNVCNESEFPNVVTARDVPDTQIGKYRLGVLLTNGSGYKSNKLLSYESGYLRGEVCSSVIICEEIDDCIEWLTDCQWIERQKLGDFHDPIAGSVAPLDFISPACGDFLDPDIRGGVLSLFGFVACIWTRVAGLYTNLEPSVLASFAAEAVKSYSWPLGLTGPWQGCHYPSNYCHLDSNCASNSNFSNCILQ